VRAYAKAGHAVLNLFDAVSLQIITSMVDTFNPQDISNNVWVYAKAGRATLDLFDVIASQIITRKEQLDAFNHQDISITVYAYATFKSYYQYGSIT